MFSFFGQYAALAKTIIYALLAAVAGFLGLNYVRRGQKIDAQKQQIKELNVKAEVTAKNVAESNNLQKTVADIDKEPKDKLLDDVNKLPK